MDYEGRYTGPEIDERLEAAETNKPLFVHIVVNYQASTATLAPGETITKLDIWNALRSGRQVIGADNNEENTFPCFGGGLGDVDGGSAKFFTIDYNGNVRIFYMYSLKF